MNDNLNELFFAFMEQMKVRRYAKSTLTEYSRYVGQFLEYLRSRSIIDLRQVTKDMLTAYQIGVIEFKDDKGRSYTTSTIGTKTRGVKRFFEFLEESNHILINPAEHIKEPRKETRLPRVVLTEDEARKILDQPNLSTPIGIRDRTILEVFYSTGIRLEELVNLTIFDCDLQGGMLRVNKGKMAKDRVVPVGKHAVRFLKEYITRIRPNLTKNNRTLRTLFVSRYGTPISWQVIGKMVGRCGQQAGVSKKVTAHVFRHTFATQLVRNGAEITAVQKMMGHSCLRVTQMYTKVAGVEVKKTHAQSHPREKDKTDRAEKPETRGFFHYPG
jgi:integrase/recombinase XerD